MNVFDVVLLDLENSDNEAVNHIFHFYSGQGLIQLEVFFNRNFQV
jgi:hypothetical protein